MIYPTLCDLGGIEKPEFLEGKSLVKTLHNPKNTNTGYALSQFARYGSKFIGRALRTDRFRYVAWFDREGKIISRELYDHFTDSGETKNLAAKPDFLTTVQKLEKELKKAFQR